MLKSLKCAKWVQCTRKQQQQNKRTQQVASDNRKIYISESILFFQNNYYYFVHCLRCERNPQRPKNFCELCVNYDWCCCCLNSLATWWFLFIHPSIYPFISILNCFICIFAIVASNMTAGMEWADKIKWANKKVRMRKFGFGGEYRS